MSEKDKYTLNFEKRQVEREKQEKQKEFNENMNLLNKDLQTLKDKFSYRVDSKVNHILSINWLELNINFKNIEAIKNALSSIDKVLTIYKENLKEWKISWNEKFYAEDGALKLDDWIINDTDYLSPKLTNDFMFRWESPYRSEWKVERIANYINNLIELENFQSKEKNNSIKETKKELKNLENEVKK